MTSPRRKLLVGAVTAAALIAGVLGVTASANADDVEAKASPIYTKDGHGSVTFYADGDKFRLWDHKKDGYGLRAIYTIGGQGNDYMYNNSGFNTKKWYNRDFAEGTKLKVQVCLTKRGTPIGSTCSGWVSRTA